MRSNHPPFLETYRQHSDFQLSESQVINAKYSMAHGRADVVNPSLEINIKPSMNDFRFGPWSAIPLNPQIHILHLQVFIHAILRAFSANSTLLHSAERSHSS